MFFSSITVLLRSLPSKDHNYDDKIRRVKSRIKDAVKQANDRSDETKNRKEKSKKVYW